MLPEKSKTGELVAELASYVSAHGGFTLPHGLRFEAITRNVKRYTCFPEIGTREKISVLVTWTEDVPGAHFILTQDGEMTTDHLTTISYNAEAMAHEILDQFKRADILGFRESRFQIRGFEEVDASVPTAMRRLEAMNALPGLLWKSVNRERGFSGPRMWIFPWGAIVESDRSPHAYIVEFEKPLLIKMEDVYEQTDVELDECLTHVGGYDRLFHPKERMGAGMVREVAIDTGIEDLMHFIQIKM